MFHLTFLLPVPFSLFFFNVLSKYLFFFSIDSFVPGAIQLTHQIDVSFQKPPSNALSYLSPPLFNLQRPSPLQNSRHKKYATTYLSSEVAAIMEHSRTKSTSASPETSISILPRTVSTLLPEDLCLSHHLAAATRAQPRSPRKSTNSLSPTPSPKLLVRTNGPSTTPSRHFSEQKSLFPQPEGCTYLPAGTVSRGSPVVHKRLAMLPHVPVTSEGKGQKRKLNPDILV